MLATRSTMQTRNRLDSAAIRREMAQDDNRQAVNSIAAKVSTIGRAEYRTINGSKYVWDSIANGWKRF